MPLRLVIFACSPFSMKKIQSYKTVLFILGVLFFLGRISYFMPEDGRLDLGFTTLKFLSSKDVINPEEKIEADITDIIADIDTSMTAPPPELIKHENGSNGDMGAPNGGSYEVESSTELQMNDDGIANLHRFFEKLSSVAANRSKISILHYGDSQIEGDRMTGFIRERIQSQFGGNGPGLVPALNVYNTFAFTQSTSENFERYTCFGGEKLKSAKYGAVAAAARFTPEHEADSATLAGLEETVGWIEVGPNNRAYGRARSFNNVRMHYNGCVAPTLLRVYKDGAVIHEDSLIMDGAQHTVKLTFPSTPGNLKYEFSGKISPNICGFSLEGDYGVQVSNIGMRGSSGTVFTGMNQAALGTMHRELNTELIVMQYGGNSVPFFKDSAAVRGFARFFKSQINVMKRHNPNAMVVVIGPSDMSKLVEGEYETYEFLPYCVEQMIEVTKSTGSAYWNLYAGMGGFNSMPAWVEKGLAGKDYTHFTNAGSKFASQMFYNALMAEYGKWQGGN